MLTISHDQILKKIWWCHISHILCPSSMDSARSGCRVWTRQQGIQASYPSAGRCLNAQPLSARENRNLLGPFVRFVMQMLPLRAIIVRFYLPSTLAGSCQREVMPSYAWSRFHFLRCLIYLNSVDRRMLLQCWTSRKWMEVKAKDAVGLILATSRTTCQGRQSCCFFWTPFSSV